MVGRSLVLGRDWKDVWDSPCSFPPLALLWAQCLGLLWACTSWFEGPVNDFLAKNLPVSLALPKMPVLLLPSVDRGLARVIFFHGHSM